MKFRKAMLAGLATVALGAASAASAAVIQIGTFGTGSIVGNDCAGALGTPPNCFFNGSPLIAKYKYAEGAGTWALDGLGLFASISGNEFTFAGGANSGTFTYNPGAGDPLVRYWSVKAGNQYQVFWRQDITLAVDPNNAIAFGAGTYSWTTGVNNAVSHILFLDSVPPAVPAPATLGLLGLGLMGLGLARRRKA